MQFPFSSGWLARTAESLRGQPHTRLLCFRGPRERARKWIWSAKSCSRAVSGHGHTLSVIPALMSCVSRAAQLWRFGPSRWDCFPLIPSVHAAKHLPWCRFGEPPRHAALFFFALNGESIADPEPVSLHVTQRTGLADNVPQRQPQKTSSPLASVSLLALQLYRCSIGFPNAWLMMFAILRTPTRMSRWSSCDRHFDLASLCAQV